jgi:hypothetical protein
VLEIGFTRVEIGATNSLLSISCCRVEGQFVGASNLAERCSATTRLGASLRRRVDDAVDEGVIGGVMGFSQRSNATVSSQTFWLGSEEFRRVCTGSNTVDICDW